MNSKPNLDGIGMTSRRTRERLIGRLMERGIKNMELLEVMRTTPRHIFLEEALAHRAYEDVALPIGHGQTISQPWMVARMTEEVLGLKRLDRVLEIGTGCGYQTAIIAALSKSVFTVERIKPLLSGAKTKLKLLGLRNIQYKHDDGTLGWAEKGPFDAILAAAAPQQVPQELLEQLSDGGKLVIPIGDESEQRLLSISRRGDEYEQQLLQRVKFVPMLRGQVKH